MKYRIEQRINTLAENYIGVTGGDAPQFTIDGVIFYQWEFSVAQGSTGNAWLAEATIEAESLGKAYSFFRQKIIRIIPIAAFVSQCYMNPSGQPFLIQKEGSDVAYFYDIYAEEGVGLHFDDGELQAVQELHDNKEIPAEFYYYWADATNTAGYSARLLLMCAAVERISGKKDGKRDRDKTVEILGQELADLLFDGRNGLRHRLMHGDYLEPSDTDDDVTELIHQKVTEYFNKSVLTKELLNTDVVGPLRHPDNNLYAAGNFIKSKDGQPLELKAVLDDVADSPSHFNLKHYQHYHDDTLKNY